VFCTVSSLLAMVKPRFVGTPPTPTYIFEVPLWIGEENGSHRKFLSALQIFDCCTGRFGEAGIVGCGENALSGPRTPRLTLVSRYRRMRGMPSVSEKRVEAAANCVSLNRNVWSGSTLEMALLAEFALQEQAAARLGRLIRPQISRLPAALRKPDSLPCVWFASAVLALCVVGQLDYKKTEEFYRRCAGLLARHHSLLFSADFSSDYTTT